MRVRIVECMDYFHLAAISLKGNLPQELDKELQAISTELQKYTPTVQSNPQPCGLFNGGRGKKGTEIALKLSHRILALYTDIYRYDAVRHGREVFDDGDVHGPEPLSR